MRISHSPPSSFPVPEETPSPLPIPNQEPGARLTRTEGLSDELSNDLSNDLSNLTRSDFLVHPPLGVTSAPSTLLSPSPSESGISINNIVDTDATFEPHLICKASLSVDNRSRYVVKWRSIPWPTVVIANGTIDETEPINETGNAHAGQEMTPTAFASASLHHSRGGLNTTSAALRNLSGDSGHSWDLQPKPYYDLPKYIDPLPARLSDDDITYLSRKGALAIPPVQLRNALLKSYVECVHPFLPLIELERLLMIIEYDDSAKGSISLLLFQSILFAASAFVPAEFISAAGYLSRKEARKTYFEKARVCHLPKLRACS